jgi:ribosomal protein S18 acetylase RimI-like enzyme
MAISLRMTQPADAAALAELIARTWQDDDNPDAAFVASALTEDIRHTMLACDGDKLVGCVDCFPTLAADGTPRWEVDLLGVDAGYRGQGIAGQLVAASVRHEDARQARLARALVRVSNHAAQHVFVRASFQQHPDVVKLYVAPPDDAPPGACPEGAHVVVVPTLTYHGGWLEGVLSASALAYARRMCALERGKFAGVTIPAGDTALLVAAEALGYSYIADFHWWTLPLSKTV